MTYFQASSPPAGARRCALPPPPNRRWPPPSRRAAPRPQAVAIWAPAAVSVGPYKGNITLQQGVLTEITTPEVTLDVRGAGVFPGRMETAEYTVRAAWAVA